MRIVIADAGPLIALAGVGQLELLVRLFGTVVVTPTVVEEVLQGGDFADTGPIRDALTHGGLQQVVDPDAAAPDQVLALMNLYQIDPGEAHSLAYAQRTQAMGGQALLVMDDLRGRSAAQHAEVPVIGTAGILLLAKRQGHLTAVQPVLSALRSNGYFLSQRLIEATLQQAGE